MSRLRVAVQKSGRLSERSLEILQRCGLRFAQSKDKLFWYGQDFPVDLLLLRDDDIPRLLLDGVCELGIVGRNVLSEQALEQAAQGQPERFRELRSLGFGGCRLSIAVPQEQAYAGPADLAGLRIATSYPRLLERWLREHGVAAAPVVLNGSVEIAPRLGTADAVCDLVSSGATLVANQLRETEVLLRSEAVLAGTTKPPADQRGELMELLLRRLDGVLAVKDSKLVMLHARRDALPAITRLLPGHARPSVTPLEGSADEVALQAVCTGAITWQHLEDMKRAGASALLVLPVEKMLA